MKKLILAWILIASPMNGQGIRPTEPVKVDDDTSIRVESVTPRVPSAYYDFVLNTFGKPGEHHPKAAANANTLGEVPDSSWFQNRHAQQRMTPVELARGPNTSDGPLLPWTVVGLKDVGITPGMKIRDARGDKYLLKFDPPKQPEMASAAEVISTKILYAAGFNVPENYIAVFRRSDLQIDPAVFPVTSRQLDHVFNRLPSRADGSYRVLASKWIAGKIAGPFQYFGTRPDDPNDVIPHENRRELRGLRVIDSWLDHNDAKSLNTLDTLIADGQKQYLKHYLIDFGSTLGSAGDSVQDQKAGWEYLWDPKPTIVRIATLGLVDRQWVRAKYVESPETGRLDFSHFDPGHWKPRYPNPAFRNALLEDCYWAAKVVMSFTDEDIRTIVRTGELSDPDAENALVRWLTTRRDRIGSYWFSRADALDHFEVSSNGNGSHSIVAIDKPGKGGH